MWPSVSLFLTFSLLSHCVAHTPSISLLTHCGSHTLFSLTMFHTLTLPIGANQCCRIKWEGSTGRQQQLKLANSLEVRMPLHRWLEQERLVGTCEDSLRFWKWPGFESHQMICRASFSILENWDKENKEWKKAEIVGARLGNNKLVLLKQSRPIFFSPAI